MTEDEAKTNRCCGPEGCGFKANDDERFCIGSRCMVWRWTDQQSLLDAVEWVQADPQRKLEDFKPRNPTNGFCGLAGKP